MVTKTKLVPPDGGYGWFIAGAYALHQFIAVPTMQIYGLLFKDAFKDLGFSATDTTFVMNTHVAISMFMGIANGPLLKCFGYRKMSIIGASLFTLGIVATSLAHTLSQYIITFSTIAAIGVGIGLTSYPVAFNTYFLKKRARSAGYALAISGFGIVLIPQFISFLLPIYGMKGAALIMGSLTSHVFIGAVLLQPVKRHMKKEVITADDPQEAAKDKLLAIEGDFEDNRQHATSKLSLQDELDIESKYSVSTPFGSVLSLHSILPRNRSVGNLDLLSEENPEIVTDGVQKEFDVKEVSLWRRIRAKMVDTFDLTLLKDPIYVNILFGLSLAMFAEMNFVILIPFIMNDYGLSISQTATFISTMAITDICFRFMAPYASEFFKLPPRILYLWTLFFVLLARFSLFLSHSNYYLLLLSAVSLGSTKGFRAVSFALVMPNHVPLERLASALGLQSTLNGTLIWMGAPFFGFIRDFTGSYRNCIYIINMITSITPIIWLSEFIYLRWKCKKKLLEFN